MTTVADAQIEITQIDPRTLLVRLAGAWVLSRSLPDIAELVMRQAAAEPVRRIVLDTKDLKAWDSMLVASLTRLNAFCTEHRIDLDLGDLPEGARRLVTIATAVPERAGAHRPDTRTGLLATIGSEALEATRSMGEMLGFLGETLQAFAMAVRGRARFRWSDVLQVMQENGPAALPIVTLVNLLVGMIVAFIGAVQLQQFGAEIYIANLVGIGVVREMGPMMTAIILAGRTSAAFAAQLGTMQVNEEIAAFRTLGIPPMQFLVLPRVMALAVMMPLLVIYANIIGIFGGAIVALTKLNLSLPLFYEQLVYAVTVNDWIGGLIKSIVFGIIVVLSGCLRGMQAERSASAVGAAATSAVVTSIVFIIATDAVFAVIYIVLGV